MSGLDKEIAPIVAEELRRYMPDLVEVVRCKDCMILQFCRFAQGLGLNGFCSQGERREDETD